MNATTSRLCLLLAAALAALASQAHNITGRVTCGGHGIAGVAVSDGITVTTTDAGGYYSMTSGKMNGYVFVTVPRGYEPACRDGFDPQFWQLLNHPDSTVAEVHDFALNRVDNDNYTLIVGADTHLARRLGDRKAYKRGFIARLKQEKKQAQARGERIYSILLGDLTWDAFWYSNNYNLASFMADQRDMGYPMPLFPVIGNHDNDGAVPPSEGTDLLASKPWRTIVCPNYYSFDLGRVHYVVLDDIYYKNDDLPGRRRTGIAGARNYEALVTDYQLKWLRQDLALVDKSTPVIVCQHIPAWHFDHNRQPVATIKNIDALATCFKGFKRVHVLTGHTHVNRNVHPAAFKTDTTSMWEHNIAAVCATWWWTGQLSGREMCTDGSPAGYSKWTIAGDSLQWQYASIQDESNPQCSLWDMNQVNRFMHSDSDVLAMKALSAKVPNWDNWEPNTVLVNVYACDDDWSIEATEDGRLLPVTPVRSAAPGHFLAYALPYFKKHHKVPGDNMGLPTFHIFKVQAATPDHEVSITVRDSFGRVYRRTLARPAAFKL